MNNKKVKLCPHCGAKMVEYKHNLSRGLGVGLWRLYQAGKPVNLRKLKLTRTQWDNFQKLRYWGLVAPAERDDGKRIGGTWVCTPMGREFVEGRSTVKKTAVTYRGNTVSFEGLEMAYADIAEPYQTRPEYARGSKPHGGAQEDLFGGQP